MMKDHGFERLEMTSRAVQLIACLSASLFVLSSTGCDQTVSEDPDDGEVASIEVVYNETTVTIDLTTVETITLDDGMDYARLSDIVTAADLGVAAETLEFDFEGVDGYRPSTRSTCVDHIPATWEMLQGGYVHRTNQNMAWDEALEMPGCSHVDEMMRIHAIDAGTLRRSVEVEYDGNTVVVDMRELDRVTFEGEEAVLLSDIIGFADLGVPLASLEFNFLAADGYRPSDSGNCTDFVPVAGPALEDGFLTFDGVNLLWDSSLEFPGCLYADDVARIEATDAAVTGPTIELVYHGDTVTVDLDDAEVVQFEGADHVTVSNVFELAALGVDAADLLFNFEASDGFMPNNSGNCADLFPIAGDQLGYGYIELATRNLAWHDDAGLPGCSFVDDVVRLHVTDADTSEGPFIDVIYGDATTTIDLSALEAVTFRGNPHVELADIIEAAELGVAMADLEFDFIADDGYRSTDAATCAGVAPVPGAQLVDGYVNLETSDLDWTDESEMPGCVRVNGLAQVEALDPA